MGGVSPGGRSARSRSRGPGDGGMPSNGRIKRLIVCADGMLFGLIKNFHYSITSVTEKRDLICIKNRYLAQFRQWSAERRARNPVECHASFESYQTGL